MPTDLMPHKVATERDLVNSNCGPRSGIGRADADRDLLRSHSIGFQEIHPELLVEFASRVASAAALVPILRGSDTGERTWRVGARFVSRSGLEASLTGERGTDRGETGYAVTLRARWRW